MKMRPIFPLNKRGITDWPGVNSRKRGLETSPVEIGLFSLMVIIWLPSGMAAASDSKSRLMLWLSDSGHACTFLSTDVVFITRSSFFPAFVPVFVAG